MENNEKNRDEPRRNEPKQTSTQQSESVPVTTERKMASVSSSGPAPSSVQVDEFVGCEPKMVTSQKVVDADINKKYWDALYQQVNVPSAGEPTKRKIRCAVYTYCAINGCSRVGEYSNQVVAADGTSFNASCIAKACNTREVRKWMRANADEAVRFFRVTGILQKNNIIVQRALDRGYPADAVIGIIDFVGESKELTIQENRLNTVSFEHSLQRARGAREGKTLEKIEQEMSERTLDAQDGSGERGEIIHV